MIRTQQQNSKVLRSQISAEVNSPFKKFNDEKQVFHTVSNQFKHAEESRESLKQNDVKDKRWSLHNTTKGRIRRIVNHFSTRRRRKKQNYKSVVEVRHVVDSSVDTESSLVQAQLENIKSTVVNSLSCDLVKETIKEKPENFDALNRKITEVRWEKSRKEEEFLEILHDLSMLSEMEIDGSVEKIALIKQIEILRNKNTISLNELQDILSGLESQIPNSYLSNDTTPKYPSDEEECESTKDFQSSCDTFDVPSDDETIQKSNVKRVPITNKNEQIQIHVSFMEKEKVKSNNGTIHIQNAVNCDEKKDEYPTEDNPCTIESLQPKDLIVPIDDSMPDFDVEQELKKSIYTIDMERKKLQTEYDSCLSAVSGLLNHVIDIEKSTAENQLLNEKLQTLTSERQEVIKSNESLMREFNEEWDSQILSREIQIKAQTEEMESMMVELVALRKRADTAMMTLEKVEFEKNEFQRRYEENSETIVNLKKIILEEETRSKEILNENFCKLRDEDLATLKNELSVMSLENVLLKEKVEELTLSLLQSDIDIKELNAHVSDVVTLLEQLRNQNSALSQETSRLNAMRREHQLQYLKEKLELSEEIKVAKENILQLQLENISLSQANVEYSKKVSAVMEKSDSVEQDVDGSVHSHDAMLRDLLQQARIEKETIQTKYDTLFKYMADIEAQNTYQLENLMDALHKIESDAEYEKEELKVKHQIILRQVSVLESQNEEQLSHFIDHLREVEMEIYTVSQERNQFSATANDLSEQMQKMQLELEQLRKQV